MTSDDATFFLNIAVIGGTLLALSFVTLQFFLSDLLKRYELTGLPVVRSRNVKEGEQPSDSVTLPDSLKYEMLFDGDPLVIFMAFSVAVTWIQFLVPLTIGLTTAWFGEHLGVLASELTFLLGAFAFSFVTRNKAIERLRPYLTREELLWPLFGAILLAFYAVAAAVAMTSALSTITHVPAFLMVWNRWGIGNEKASLFALKFVCILALLVGTYTTNKDMFIFFKSVAAERMRRRWLISFVHERYPKLRKRVDMAKSETLQKAQLPELLRKWNEGCPEIASTHDAFIVAGQRALTQVWRELIEGRSGAPSWMLDVPRIANWESEVEELLRRHDSPAGAAAVA